MHLTSISGRHIKGGDFDISLSRANVIHGENFAGKTRIADAVRLLLVGHLPELGKTNPATFGLASGPFMEVSGILSDGSTIRRRWTAKGDSVKMEAEIPDHIRGLSTPVLAVMLNAEEYFALSDRDRVNYVFANCPTGDLFSYESIAARVLKAAPGLNMGTIMSSENCEKPLAEWIESFIEKVSDDWKAAKEQAKRFEETVRGLTHLRALDAQARPLAALEDDRAKLEREHTTLLEQRGRVEVTYSEQRKAVERRAAIAREINTTDKDALEKVSQDQKLELVLLEMQTVAKTPAPNVKALLEARTAAIRAKDAAKINLGALRHQVDETEKGIASIDEQKVCPFCGAAGDGWKTLRIAELSGRCKDLTEKVGIQVNELGAASIELERAERAYEQGDRDAQFRIHLGQEEARVRTRLSDLDRRLERRRALEEERDRLPAFDPLLDAHVQEIQGQINVNRQEARALDQEIRLGLGRAQDLKRLGEAETARDLAVAGAELCAIAGKELRVIQGELVEEAFRPLLEHANGIFQSILPSPLAYRDGEIGTWRSGQWVGHRTFSGVEKALTYAAIQAALSALSPVRVMLLDELGRMTSRSAAMVARCILGAIDEGLIDQFIGIDPERTQLYIETELRDRGEGVDPLGFQILEIGQ